MLSVVREKRFVKEERDNKVVKLRSLEVFK